MRGSAEPQRAASHDQARVEAEFYEAIYGARTGTVENIALIDTATAPGDPGPATEPQPERER